MEITNKNYMGNKMKLTAELIKAASVDMQEEYAEKIVSLGTFPCTYGLLIVDDVIYLNNQLKALCGTWTAFVITTNKLEDSRWGGVRNKELIAVHNDYLYLQNDFGVINHLEKDIVCGVDACNAVIFDGAVTHLELDEKYGLYNPYLKNKCEKYNIPYKEDLRLWDFVDYEPQYRGLNDTITDIGPVVMSGYGDGSYPVYTLKNNKGEAYAVKVLFIDDNGESAYATICEENN